MTDQETPAPGDASGALKGAKRDMADEQEHRAEVLGMARQGGLNFTGALFNQALRFAITFLVARLLGPSGAGLYYQSFAFLAFLGLVASVGFTMTLTRYVAVHRADGDEAALHGTVRLGLFTTTLTSVALGIVLYATAPWLADIAFHEPRLSTLLRFVAIALPASVYTDAALSATQGFKTMKAYALINLIFEPACRLLLTVGLLAIGQGLKGVMVALVVTNWIAGGLSWIALRRLLGPAQTSPRYDAREIFAFSALSWASNLATNGLLWADTIILSIFGASAAVGVYQVATRLTLLATVFVQPVTNSFAPRIADLWRRGRYDVLNKTYVLITSWMFRLALPSFVLLLIFPRELLALFGRGFEAGVSVTLIMTVTWVLNTLGGPSYYVLTMSGRAGVQMTNNIAALGLNLALNVWLIPLYGIVGAAVAWSASLVALTVVRVVQVWSFSGMLPFGKSVVKGLGAGLAAGVTALAVRQVLEGFSALAVGAVALGAVYIAAIRILGVDEDDRLVLTALVRRLRVGSTSPRRGDLA